MKLRNKLEYFINDLYETIEELYFIGSMDKRNNELLLHFLNDTFHSNFGTLEQNRKEYVYKDRIKELKKFVPIHNGKDVYSKEIETFLTIDQVKEIEAIKNKVFDLIHQLTYKIPHISTDVQLFITDRFGGMVCKDRYLKIL